MGLRSALAALFQPEPSPPATRVEPKAPAARALDAGGFGWRNQGWPAFTSPGVLHGQRLTIGARAQREAINNPTVARVVETLVACLVGTGIVPRPRHPSEAVRAELIKRFDGWGDDCSADGRGGFYDLQQAAARDLVVRGEALFAFTADPDTAMPRLRHLDPEQLDASVVRATDGGGWVDQGVEFDSSGRIAAYWIRPNLGRADAAAGMALAPVRVPAADVLHVFRKVMPGQVRGISMLASILVPAKNLDELADALLMRTRTAASYSVFIREGDASYTGWLPTLMDTNFGADETSFREEMEDAALSLKGKPVVSPGMGTVLPPGWEADFPDLPDVGGAENLYAATLRSIAAGAGTTYEAASGDYSSVNYSSARVAELNTRRWHEMIQHGVLVPQFCAPVWRRFIAWQVLSGILPAAAYMTDRRAYDGAKWLPPASPWVDPKNEAEAAEIALRGNLRSRTEIAAERGVDIEDLDREIAADRARERALGLVQDPAPTSPPSARQGDLDRVLFRAAFKPSSVNDAARTVELVASTGAGVVRADLAGPFLEVLTVTPQAVDLGRVEGMPLLDSHRQDSLDRVLGVVRAARIEAGQLIVTVEVSPRADAYWQDIRGGILRNVSIGYAPKDWADGKDALGARVRTVTRWELREVSLVPVGADPTAQVRTSE